MIRIDLNKDKLTPKKGRFSVLASKLNLKVPPKLEEKLNKWSQDVALLITLGVGIGIAVIPSLLEGQWEDVLKAQHQESMRQLDEKIGAADQEIQRMSALEAELKNYQTQKETALKRLDAMKALLEQRNSAVLMLDNVGQALPKNAWLENLSLQVGLDSSMSMRCLAMDTDDVTLFVDRLTESIYMSNVKLEEVSVRKDSNQVEIRAFNITAKPKLKLAIRTISNTTNVPPQNGMGAAPNNGSTSTQNQGTVVQPGNTQNTVPGAGK